jgi:hypothetical protein
MIVIAGDLSISFSTAAGKIKADERIERSVYQRSVATATTRLTSSAQQRGYSAGLRRATPRFVAPSAGRTKIQRRRRTGRPAPA